MKRLSYLLLACSMIIALLNLPVIGEDVGMEPQSEELVQLSGTETLVGMFEGYVLTVNTERGYFSLEKNGKIWSSNPVGCEEDEKARDVWKGKVKCQLVVDYTDKTGKMKDQINSSTHCAAKDGLTVYKTTDGIKLNYYFPLIEATIPLYIRIRNGYIDAEVLMDSIVYENDKYMITEISILPFFGAGMPDENGYILVPESSGGLINFNNGKKNTDGYKIQVYGSDASIAVKKISSKKVNASMPVFGLQGKKQGVFAVITEGDGLAIVHANTGGNFTSYNHAFSSFALRSFDSFTLQGNSGEDRYVQVVEKGEIKVERINVRYYLLEGNGDYMRMVEQYREYLLNEKQMAKISKQPDLFLTLYGAVAKKKPVMGIPFTVTEKLTTYTQAEKIAADLRENGGGDIVLKYAYSNKQNIHKKEPQNSERFGGLGSEKELASLKEHATVFTEVDGTNVNKMFFDFIGLNQIAKDLMELPAYRQPYNLASGHPIDEKRWTVTKPDIAADLMNKALAGYQKSDVNSAYIAEIGSSLYSDFSRNGVGRQDAINAYSQALQPFAAEGMALMVDLGNAYTLPYASYIADMETNAVLNAFIDVSIPFSQLVINGCKGYAIKPINMSSNQQKDFMKAIETGSALAFSFIYEDTTRLDKTELDNQYALDYHLWRDDAVELIARYQDVIDKTGRLIDRHEVFENGGVKVTYQNGSVAYFNYSDNDLIIEGTAVSAMDMKIISGGEG